MVVVERGVADVRARDEERTNRGKGRERRTSRAEQTIRRAHRRQRGARALQRSTSQSAVAHRYGHRLHQHRQARWRLKEVVAVRQIVMGPRRHLTASPSSGGGHIPIAPTHEKQEPDQEHAQKPDTSWERADPIRGSLAHLVICFQRGLSSQCLVRNPPKAKQTPARRPMTPSVATACIATAPSLPRSRQRGTGAPGRQRCRRSRPSRLKPNGGRTVTATNW